MLDITTVTKTMKLPHEGNSKSKHSSEFIRPIEQNTLHKQNIPTVARKAICLPDINDITKRPNIIKPSDNLILTLVNISGTNNIRIYPHTKALRISINGLCSSIYSVVFPIIIFIKYVYGVKPIGVSNPINKLTTKTISKYLTFLFFLKVNFLIKILLFNFNLYLLTDMLNLSKSIIDS